MNRRLKPISESKRNDPKPPKRPNPTTFDTELLSAQHEAPKARPAKQVRAIQLTVANEIYQSGEFRRDREREAALAEVLQVLGIYYRTGDSPRQLVVRCGTISGYRRHLIAYQTPCNPCVAARQRELDERWRNLGIDNPGEVVIPV